MSLYCAIENTLIQHADNLYVGQDVTESDIRYAILCVMRNNPDIFWFANQYHFDEAQGKVYFRYQFSMERSTIIQQSINDVIEKDFQIDYVRTLKTLEKVAYVYKWMLAYCNYNVNSAYNQNIDSVFMRRNSVCMGYAKAAQYLFKLLGIESRLVFGKLNNDREDGRHCWNIVCIDGEYYHLDVCLGDIALEDTLKKAGTECVLRCGDFNYNCFCVSTDAISSTRSIEDVKTLPLCNSVISFDAVAQLSRIKIREREELEGCILTHIGSTADIYLCARDKNVILKKFRKDNRECATEYDYISKLKGCTHLLQLSEAYTDIEKHIIAIEQSTPIVDLFCSHYYHPTLRGLLLMAKDITTGWIECCQRGILYRDIHVCNIYRANDGTYKLGDFGNCTYRHKNQTEHVGSHWFMSPETYISGQFSEQSAVYSIISVLYFILNGLCPPFLNDNNKEDALLLKMGGEALHMPSMLQSLPEDLAKGIMNRLIAQGCAHNPLDRFGSCKELLHEINHLLSDLGNCNIELQFLQQDTWYNVFSASDMPKDMHHRFAYGEDVESIAVSTCYEKAERMSTTACPDFNFGGYRPFKTVPKQKINNYDKTSENNADLDAWIERFMMEDDVPIADDVEKYCLTEKWCCPSDETIINIPHTQAAPVLYEVYSSIFAPAEVKRKSHMMVQVYLHLLEETEKVKALAIESQKDAERRDYIPLQGRLKKGDKIDVLLNIYGETLLMSERKSLVWQGTFTKCSFDYFVPKDIDADELSCMALLSVNDIPVGEMRFITNIVDSPRQLHPEVFAHKYNKVFISYAHKDEAKVKFLAEGFELMDIPHFFDRHYLKTGDVFPKVIQDYINSADLFILCWSENASKSEYVKKERLQALARAYPQIQPAQAAKLSIYPMNIEPRAELPADMKENYHFGEM